MEYHDSYSFLDMIDADDSQRLYELKYGREWYLIQFYKKDSTSFRILSGSNLLFNPESVCYHLNYQSNIMDIPIKGDVQGVLLLLNSDKPQWHKITIDFCTRDCSGSCNVADKVINLKLIKVPIEKLPLYMSNATKTFCTLLKGKP